jgi:peptidoglycan/LPS O-acetylase OafA/YrhL
VNLIPNKKADTRIPELDGIRGLAVLLILIAHYVFGSFTPDDESILAVSVHFVFSLAWSGVDLFFVLSGFLIGGILIDQRGTENYFKTFYLRRICRIFPLYFLWLIIFVILFFLISARFHQKWVLPLFDLQGIPQWLYFFFLQNFRMAKSGLFGPCWLGSTWSLAIEEQFYLLMPLIIWLMPARKLPHLLVLLILMVPLFRIYLYLYHYNIFQYVLLPCRADSLLLGVLCACLFRNKSARDWLEANQPRLFQMFIVLMLGGVYLTFIAKGKDVFYVGNLFEITSWGYTCLASFYACLLLIVLTAKSGMIVGIMRLPMLRKLGTIAYGVYLIQGVMLLVAHGLMGKEASIKNFSDGLITFAALVATLLLAKFSWRFFEKPIIDYGHSFSYDDKNTRHEGKRIRP